MNEQKKYILSRLAELLRIDIFCQSEGTLVGCQRNSKLNPIFSSKPLRQKLMKEADGQNLPLLHKEEDSIYFICVKSGKRYYFAGPLGLGELNKVELHKYYERYGIKAEKERSLKRFQFSEMMDIAQMIRYRNTAIEKLTSEVKRKLEQKHTSSYVEQSKDYVRKHYREKIYLNDIADTLGVSASYLSRLFSKETGERLQDYITRVRIERAANLLIYSDESLSKIAEYINFPSQSYFGRVFREQMKLSPRKYREIHKPKEF